MFVAHEEGGKVTAFRMEDDDTLLPAGIDIPVPGAVFLLEAPELLD